MTGMEHAIEQATTRRAVATLTASLYGSAVSPAEREKAERAIAALSRARLLAPAPLREEHAISYTPATGTPGQHDLTPEEARDFMERHGTHQRRWISDWEAVDRAEGDGRADHAPAVDCEDHRPRQHRDGKPPWCHACGMDANGLRPVFKFDHLLHDGKADL